MRNVKLTILDILGREIIVPVNEKLLPGYYEVSWDASGLTSGAFYYSLFIDNISFDTKKMILAK